MSKIESKSTENSGQGLLHSVEHRKLFVDWFSGLCGGFVSVTCCAPLDLARTRHMVLATTKSYGIISYGGFLDTIKTIYQHEGIRGLYKGYSVTAFAIPFFHSMYFSTYYRVKNWLYEGAREQTSLKKNIQAAIMTGFICDTLTNPLWVVRTRIQSQFLHNENKIKYKGLMHGLRKIYRQEGLGALYKGLIASYVGLAHAAILYPLYEELKFLIQKYKGSLSNTDIFIASLGSKCKILILQVTFSVTAMVLTFPHVVLRARLQDNRTKLNSNDVKLTLSSVVRNTIKNEGFFGLYSGLRIDLVRCLPANAITFLTFEYVKRHLESKLLPH